MKRYVHEAHSAAVRRHLRADRIATSRLSEVEVASALARREREGAFTSAERDRAIAILNKDLAALVIVELTPEIAAGAQGLLLRHELRAGDAVQLASALYLQRQTGRPVPFAAFDARLTSAARAEGLTVTAFL